MCTNVTDDRRICDSKDLNVMSIRDQSNGVVNLWSVESHKIVDDEFQLVMF